MSIIEPFTRTSGHTPDAVLSHFFLGPHQKMEAEAILLVFQEMQEDFSDNTISPSERFKLSRKYTLQEVEFRYDVLKGHAENYLGGQAFDPDIVAATICANYLSTDKVREWLKANGVEEKVDTIFKEASALRKGQRGDVSNKAQFLAHVLSLEELDRLTSRINDCVEVEVLRLKNITIPDMLSFVNRKKDIGKELKRQIRFAIGHLDSQMADLQKSHYGADVLATSKPLKPQLIKAEFPLHALRPAFQDATRFEGLRTKDVNADAVFENLFIENDEILEKAAIRFVYDHLYKEETGPKKLENRYAAIDKTTDLVEDAYYMISTFADDYFFGKTYNKDALILAGLCDDLVSHPDFRNSPSFDRQTKKDAELIWHEASECGFNGELTKESYSEARFLSHVFGVTQIKYALHNLYNFKDEDDFKELHQQVLAMRAGVQPETEIGKELGQSMDILARHMFNISNNTIRQNFRIAFVANDLT